MSGRRREGGQGRTGKPLAGVSFGLLSARLSDVQAPADHALADDFDLKSAFARAYGFSLGKVAAESRRSWPPAFGRNAKDGQSSESTCGRRTAASRASTASSLPSPRPPSTPTDFSCGTVREPQVWRKTPAIRQLPARVGELILDCVICIPQSVVDRLPSGQAGSVAVSWRHDVAGTAARCGVAGVAEDGRGVAMVASCRFHAAPAWPKSAVRRAGRARPCLLGD